VTRNLKDKLEYDLARGALCANRNECKVFLQTEVASMAWVNLYPGGILWPRPIHTPSGDDIPRGINWPRPWCTWV